MTAYLIRVIQLLILLIWRRPIYLALLFRLLSLRIWKGVRYRIISTPILKIWKECILISVLYQLFLTLLIGHHVEDQKKNKEVRYYDNYVINMNNGLSNVTNQEVTTKDEPKDVCNTERYSIIQKLLNSGPEEVGKV